MISTSENSGKHISLIASYWQTYTGVRLAACLFFVIFFAQALWIYPAYQKFEQDELNRLSYTGLAIVEGLLALTATDIAPEDLKLLGETLSHNTPLKGARIYTYNGDLFAEFGERPIYEPYELREIWGNWMTTRIAHGTRIEMAWLPQDSYSPYLIVGRLDSSHVQGALDNFLNFLLKMVFSVTFVSTLLLMWLLRKSQFRPWLQKITGLEHLKASNKAR
jgi:hypothetical protein